MNNKIVKYSVYTILGLFFLFYAWLRYDNSLLVPVPRADFGDVNGYYNIASESVFSRAFWIAERPPTIPLFFKFIGRDYNKVASFQLWFSVFSWGILALTIVKVTKNIFVKSHKWADEHFKILEKKGSYFKVLKDDLSYGWLHQYYVKVKL